MAEAYATNKDKYLTVPAGYVAPNRIKVTSDNLFDPNAAILTNWGTWNSGAYVTLKPNTVYTFWTDFIGSTNSGNGTTQYPNFVVGNSAGQTYSGTAQNANANGGGAAQGKDPVGSMNGVHPSKNNGTVMVKTLDDGRIYFAFRNKMAAMWQIVNRPYNDWEVVKIGYDDVVFKAPGTLSAGNYGPQITFGHVMLLEDNGASYNKVLKFSPFAGSY